MMDSDNSTLENRIGESVPWSLRLFGGFELSVRATGDRVAPLGKRERALLAYLALSPKGRQPRRKLASLIWGEGTDQAILDNLRTCLWRLRKALGDTEHRLIAPDDEDVVLNTAAFDVDALIFGHSATQSGRTELETAADLYRGEFLEGLDIGSEEFEFWRRAEASRYLDKAVDVLSRLMMLLTECGESERAIEAGARILRLEPLHEAAARHLMRLYAENGRRGAVKEVYCGLAETLRTELNAQPEAETRMIFAEAIGSAGGSRAADHKLPRQTNAIGRPGHSPGPRTDANAADAKLLPLDARVERPREAPRKPLLTTFRAHTALAILAGMLIVTIALISHQPFALIDTHEAVVAERTVSAPQSKAVSVAVLPFENLSGDASQEYFSDGVTEEITSALAKVPNLRVVARTSAFQFKNQNGDLRAIDRKLGATYLIKGSVRKAGDRVRVNVQLVKADDGIDLWSDNYDRELNDIFATQEDIAQAIAGALRVPLGLQQGEQLVSNRTRDVDSYQQYLRARAMYRARDLEGAIKILETLVTHDPSFAPAWAQLARAYILLPNYSSVLRILPIEEARRFVQTNSDKAETAASEALRLDPKYSGGYSALADIRSLRGNWGEAEDLYRQALSLDANDPDVLSRYGMMLNNVGRLKESFGVSEQLQMIEPFVPVYNVTLASYLQVSGQDADSIRVLQGIPQDSRISLIRNTALARGYATEGRFAEAADTLLQINSDQVVRHSVEDAASWIRTAAKGRIPGTPPALEGELNFVYAYVGASDRVLDFPERGVAINYLGTSTMWFLWVPQYAALRKTERFKTLARNAGLVDYWRARGWPDLCRPVGVTDFACH